MNIVLIEDEAIAMRMLRKLIAVVESEAKIIAALDSVGEAMDWFTKNGVAGVDLIISDIQLSDGLAFDVFEKMNIRVPIIFTTAYNDYAIKAFKVNGVDYLLKPLQEKDLKAAITKYKQNTQSQFNEKAFDLRSFIENYKLSANIGAPTFLAYSKAKIIPIRSEDVAWLMTQNQILTVVLTNNQQYKLDDTLDSIEKRLPLNGFFRINRQYILSRNAIVECSFYFNNRLSVKVRPASIETIVVSREKVAAFKNWLQGLV